MLGEQYERSEGRSAATDPVKVESVPSDQLWRAAVLAARQAAIAAAELRRALDETACASPSKPIDPAPPAGAAPMVA